MSNVGYLVFLLGGIGKQSGIEISRRLRSLKQRDRCVLAYADTDKKDLAAEDVNEEFDVVFDMSLEPTQLGAIRDSPKSFGPMVEYIVAEHGRELVNEFESGAGSRTIRMLTVLAYSYFFPAILDCIHRATRLLISRGYAKQVKPMFVSSSGGGAGSSLQILFAYTFGHKEIVRKIRYGLTPFIHSPIISVLAEPFALAVRHQQSHRNKILANSVATALEMEALDYSLRPYDVIYHLGLTNDGGMLLESPEDVGRVTSNAVTQLIVCNDEIASRRADTYETRKPNDKYTGLDASKFGLEFAMDHTRVELDWFSRQLDTRTSRFNQLGDDSIENEDDSEESK